jgi:endonuclease G
MSNMSPQYCEFNRGIWQILEEQTRRWARRFGTVYVLNGSIFDRDGDGRRDQDSDADHMQSNNHKARVAVPTAFYKLLAVQRPDGTVETLMVLLPQDHVQHDGDEAMAYLQQHLTTIAAIEQRTGLRFFAAATTPPTELTRLWNFDQPSPGSLAGGCRTP